MLKGEETRRKPPLREFTMEEINAQENKDGRILVVINGQVYDVSNFLDKHPGGDLVLRNVAGKDCTDVFENYHQGRVSQSSLGRFLVGQVSDQQPVYPHVQDFRAVRQELINSGMFQVQKSYYVRVYASSAALFVVSMYFSLACGESIPCHMLGAALLGFFWQQFAGVGHDLGHSNVSQNLRQDHRVGSMLGCFLTGISMAWWKRNHNTHHVSVNSIEHDPDIQHMPIFLLSEDALLKPFWSSFYSKWVQMDSISSRLVGQQHILFFPIMLVARFNLYAQSWIFLMNSSMKTDYRRIEICALSAFACWYLTVAWSFSTWTESVAWVMLAHAVAGFLHIQIVVSHWAMETYHGHSYNTADDEWYRLQLNTTMNIECSPWMDWFHFGLQFQIEHHLFPSLPRHNLRYASKLVKEACERNGIVYHSHSITEAILMTLKTLSDMAARAREHALHDHCD
jgi:delta8-fatty-acid desaturase